MSVQTDIFVAAMTLMQDSVIDFPVAYPNVNFKPPADSIWFKIDHFPNDNRELVWGSGGTEYLGFIQVLVFFRPDVGLIQAQDAAQVIKTLFAKGTELGIVRVEGIPSEAPPVYDGDHGFIPVTIPYRGAA